MGEERKTPGRAATCPGAGQGALSSRDRPSTAHPITAAQRCQAGRVAAVLPEGKRNARPGREIASLLGLRSVRELTQAVERERRCGVPVCASNDSATPGYFMPESPEELAEYLSSLRRRLRAVGRTETALEETLARWRGQQSIKLPDGGEEV